MTRRHDDTKAEKANHITDTDWVCRESCVAAGLGLADSVAIVASCRVFVVVASFQGVPRTSKLVHRVAVVGLPRPVGFVTADTWNT